MLLYSHGFGPLVAADAPDPVTQQALLERGYALAGSSYDPNGSWWALDSAVRDQFDTLTAVEPLLPARPRHVIAVGTSMGGLISALEDENSNGRLDGSLTTCGIVAGGLNLNNYQLDGEYAMTQLLPNTPAHPSSSSTSTTTRAPGCKLANSSTTIAQSAQTARVRRSRRARPPRAGDVADERRRLGARRRDAVPVRLPAPRSWGSTTSSSQPGPPPLSRRWTSSSSGGRTSTSPTAAATPPGPRASTSGGC